VNKIRVLIVDDHLVTRVGLRTLLGMEEDLAVVGEAGDGEAALEQALRTRPHVVLMDVRMRAIDGIEACRLIRGELPETNVLMLTSYGEREAVIASLMAGASGFLLKNASQEDLLRAVRAIAAGESLLDPVVTRAVTDRLVELTQDAEDPRLAPLSEREREVLLLVARGMTNKEIAQALVISVATARNHVSHILDKLGMRGRSDLAVFAAQIGLLDPTD
jgi:two-component system, NarL family, response regulator DevR